MARHRLRVDVVLAEGPDERRPDQRRTRAAPRLELLRQHGDVGMRIGQLFGELLLEEHRGLFLELHFLDLRTRRIELLLSDEPRFFGGTKRRAKRFHRIARDRERLFRLSTRHELPLQRFFDRGPINRFALSGRL